MPNVHANPILTKTQTIEGRASTYTAYRILHFGFVALPIIAGIDKFFDVLVNWPIYLAPWITNIVTHVMSVSTFMKIGGVAEIATAIFVAVKPKYGAFLLAFWLWCIIFNLLTFPGYYDIALRDFGLSLGALALGFLAREFADNRNDQFGRVKAKTLHVDETPSWKQPESGTER